MEHDQPIEPYKRLSAAFWLQVATSVVVIAALSLGVHEAMFEGFHVPSPRPEGLPHWAPLLDTLVCLIGLVSLYRLSLSRMRLQGVITQVLILGSITIMLHETLRVLLIDITLSDAWLFQTVNALPQALYLVALSVAVVMIHRYTRTTYVAVFCVVAAAVALPFALKPALAGAFHPILAMLHRFDYPQLYFEPYPNRVFVPIYVGFIEPVIAAFVVAFFVWPSLSGGLGRRNMQFCLLIMAVKGSLLPTLLWSFWIPGPRLTAILSEAQFGLETVVLGLLTGLAWNMIDNVRATRQNVHPLSLS